MLALLKINMQGRLRFVEGDDQEPIPGIRCYTAASTPGPRSTWGCRPPAARRCSRPTTSISTRTWRSSVPIAQTLDAASNLKAQERIRKLASDPSLIVPGHDPAIFERYPKTADGIVRVR